MKPNHWCKVKKDLSINKLRLSMEAKRRRLLLSLLLLVYSNRVILAMSLNKLPYMEAAE